jgi:hypothetical protein
VLIVVGVLIAFFNQPNISGCTATIAVGWGFGLEQQLGVCD